MHNPVIRFRVVAVTLLVIAWLINLVGVGVIRHLFRAAFDSVAASLLTADVILVLLGSAALVFSLRAVMLPRRLAHEAHARRDRPSALRVVPPARTSVRVLEDAWAPEGMITTDMIGEVQDHFGFDYDEVTVRWPGHRLATSHPIGHLSLAPAALVAEVSV